MSFFNFLWLGINLFLILLILLRSPNEQSLQETLGSLNFFESSESAEKNIDKTILVLTIIYFILGFLLSSKAFEKF